MSALLAVDLARAVAQSPARLALLGTGTVGNAVLQRLAQWQGTLPGARLSLVHAANSRHAVSCRSGTAADGITDGLLRLSVGIEALEDLQADLAAGFARVEALELDVCRKPERVGA